MLQSLKLPNTNINVFNQNHLVPIANMKLLYSYFICTHTQISELQSMSGQVPVQK